MPELPEVETVVSALRPAIKGRVIRAVGVHQKGLRVPFPRGLKQRLEGRRVRDCRRRAKYILISLDNDEVLVLHLGMSGRLSLLPSRKPYKPQKHDHLVLSFNGGITAVLNDPRRFGALYLIPATGVDTHKAFAGLGPEPLERAFDGKLLGEALAGRKTTIKVALMDQKIVAGLGNIYVCEALFYAGISPLRRAGTVQGQKAQKLVRAIKRVLRAAIKAGGSTLKDYRQANGELGYFQHKFAVYGRAGQACPGCDCDISKTGGIRQITQGGRSSFYCPRKQK